jgi:transcriptional regulator with XRE-family HTH domain
MNVSIGNNIRIIREINGFSQAYMAEKLSISQKTYSNLENGRVQFSIGRLISIAEILNTTLIRIIYGIDFENSQSVAEPWQLTSHPKSLNEENEMLKEQLKTLHNLILDLSRN